MKTKLLKSILMAAFVIFGLANVTAQHVVSFDADLEGWPAGGNPPNGFATSIVWDAGSGANTGLAIIAPKENDAAMGTTATQNTIMYGPNNDGRGNGGGFNADAYNYLKITLKNETIGTDLRVRCRRDDAAANGDWTQQTWAITANDTDFKTYTFPLNAAEWSGANSDISILVRNTLGAWTSATQVSVDRIEFFNFTTTDTFAGHVQNPGFDDLIGDDGVWNPSDKAFSSTAVTDEEKVDGIQSLKMTFIGNQDTSGGGAGNVSVFSDYKGPVGPYAGNTAVTLKAKVWVKYKREAAATNADKEITIQGNWKLYLNGAGLAGVKTNNQTLTLAHDVWTEFEFETSFDDATAFNQAQFRPIFNFANAMLTGEAIYYDAINSCDGCATLGTSEFNSVEFDMYPNPVKNTLNIKSQEAISNVAVYDLLGKVVISSNKVNNFLDVSALSNGVYIIKLTSDKGVVTKKFVKE